MASRTESLSSFERSIALLDQLDRDRPGDPRVPRRPGPRPSLSGPHAHEAGKSGRGGASPASGHRSPQGPRRRVPEAVVVSHRPGAQLEQPGQRPRSRTDKTPRHSIRSARPTRSRGAWSTNTPKTRNCDPRWLSARGGWPSSSTPWADGRKAGRSTSSRLRSWTGSSPRIRPSPSSGACWRASASELGQLLIDHDEIEAGLNALAKARDQAETVRTDEPE